MTTIGGVSHGDANTIPEDLKEDYFPPNFKEYMLMEHLNWSRHKADGFSNSGWVFWSQQDHANGADFNPTGSPIPKVRGALQKFLESAWLPLSLVQFWAATTTLEGRTKLTTQSQPFALGGTYNRTERQQLCEYRMKMSREYEFYADAESGEEQLGLLDRVFLHKSPEFSPHVEYYSTKEYPQHDLALQCRIEGSWAVPVFEHSSKNCVGVLEMVSLYNMSGYWLDESFLRPLYDSFQELGLQCFDRYNTCEMHSREEIIKEKRLTHVFQELKKVLSLVCGIHKLPLAMAWVPCSACNGLRSMGVECCARKHDKLAKFLRFSERSHLRKGWVARRALSYPHTLYYPNITELSTDEYPLVPYARMCKFSGWFIFCLQNSKSEDKYVLEFFWSSSSEDSEDTRFIQERLSKLLGTMEEKLGNFLFTSGEAVGALTHVEIFNVQNNPGRGPWYEIQADRTFTDRDSDLSPEPSLASVNF